MKYFIGKLKPFAYIAGLYVIISLIMRCVFVFHPITTASFSFVEVLKICSIGLVSDVLTIVLAMGIFGYLLPFYSQCEIQKALWLSHLWGIGALLALYTVLP